MNWQALAWAIDCEGSVKLAKRKKPLEYHPAIEISMCDYDFLDELLAHFQMGTITIRQRRFPHRDLYCWKIQRKEHLFFVLPKIIPYLIIKKQKAQILLQFLQIKKDYRDPYIKRSEKVILERRQRYELCYQTIKNLTVDNRKPKQVSF